MREDLTWLRFRLIVGMLCFDQRLQRLVKAFVDYYLKEV